MLMRVTESAQIDFNDIDRLISKEETAFNARTTTLTTFADKIKKSLRKKKYYFSFFDIPEFITKIKMSKKEFQDVSRNLLFKVQKLYLVHKAQAMPTLPIEKLQITAEDNIPLELLDEVIAETRLKFDTKKSYWRDLVNGARAESQKTLALSCIEDKSIVMQQVKNNVLATYLNNRLDDLHSDVYKKHLRHKLIHRSFVDQTGT